MITIPGGGRTEGPYGMLVLSLVLIGLAITLEPIPLTAFILILASEGGVRKGAAFIPRSQTRRPRWPRWPPSSPSAQGLLVIAIRYYRKLGKPKPPKRPPKWQTHIDNMTLWYALALGPLTQPWGLIAAGVTVIVEAKLSSWESYLALALFCVIATSSLLVMEIYAGFRPRQAQDFLTRSRHWIDTHTDQVIVIVSLVLGFWLVATSIYYIVT